MTAPIIPGAEPWSADGGAHGVLVLHGFTGNPQSMRPLAEALAAAGFTVDLPLLPGHGTAVEDMVPTRWEDWSGAAEAHFQALAARCDHVAVVGLSMGGALACWLAERHPGPPGIALVNPLVQPPDAESARAPGPCSTPAPRSIDGIGSDIKKEGAVEAAYPGTPAGRRPVPVRGGRRGAGRLGDIRCPVLLLSSREDHVVDPVSGDVVVAARWAARSSGSAWRTATTWPPWTTTPRSIEARVVAFALACSAARRRRRLMAEPARLTRDDVAHVARLARLAPDRGGARPVHRPAGRRC